MSRCTPTIDLLAWPAGLESGTILSVPHFYVDVDEVICLDVLSIRTAGSTFDAPGGGLSIEAFCGPISN